MLGISSFLIEPMCKLMGARLVWAVSNFVVFVCMAGTAIISLISVHDYTRGIEHAIGASEGIKYASLVVFVLLGFPLAVSEVFSFKLFLIHCQFRSFPTNLLDQSLYFHQSFVCLCYRLPTVFPLLLQQS